MRRCILFCISIICCLNLTGKGKVNSLFSVRDLQKTPNPPALIVGNNTEDVFIDFGKDAFSQLQLELLSNANGKVTVRIGEKRCGNHVDPMPGGSIRYAEYSIDVKEGRHIYNLQIRPDARNTRKTPTGSGGLPVLMPEKTGEVYPFRYCEVVGLDGCVLSDGTRQIRVNYPFDEDASYFACSDTVLNKVWDLCKYSIKATSFCGYYVDGDRERIPYEADALVNQLSHYAVDNEYSMARRTAEYLLRNATWPTEWQFDIIFVAWYDYLYTADKSFIREHYDALKAKTLLSLKDGNGLISTRTGGVTDELKVRLNYCGTSPIRDIVDWPRRGVAGLGREKPGEDDDYVLTDYNTVVNAMHNGSLRIMAEIADALGKKDDASFFHKAALENKDAINRHLMTEDGVYRDGIGTDHCSLHANMYPLLFGIAEDKKNVIDFIKGKGMACSVYGAQFLLDALYANGEDYYASSLLNSTSLRSWYNMIRCGSTITMEAWDKSCKPNLDWNHAWGAAPANIISRWIVGVQPSEPGFKKIRIQPHLSDLTWVEGLVPSPLGGIYCKYDRTDGKTFKAEIRIPSGVNAEMILPCRGKLSSLKLNGHTMERRRSLDKCALVDLSPGTWEILVETDND